MSKRVGLIVALAALGTACIGGDRAANTDPAGRAPAGANDPAVQPLATPFPADSYMAELQHKGKVVIGVRYDAPPMARLNPVNNRVEGFEVDVGREIARSIFGDENKAEFVQVSPASRMAILRDGTADLVIAAITTADAPGSAIDVSNVYYAAGQSILVPKDSAIRDLADLSRKRVCTVQASVGETNIRQRAPHAELVLVGAYSECLAALQTKRADAISTDDATLAGIAARDKNTKLVGGIFTEEPYGIGIKKGRPEFVVFVNNVLDAMIQDGRWKRSYDRWLGEPAGVSSEEALARFR